MSAPIDERERVEVDDPPAPLTYTSYMPEVQRVASRTVQQRKKRRHVMRKISWKPLFILAMLPPLFIVGLLIFDRLRMISLPMPRATPPVQVAEQQIIYVTATPNPDLILTATGVLPPDYLQSLQQTPFAPTATIDPSVPTQVLPTATQPFVSQGTEGPHFSLLTTKIVYACWVDELYKDEICLMNADGTNKVQLTNMRGTDFYPSLSPDGQTILFSSQRGSNNFDIYAMNIDGGDIRQLTDTDGAEYAPELSPDGSQIVYTHEDEEGRQSIWVMNADGTGPRRVSFGDYSDIDPSWSPTGTEISFTSNRARGVNEVFIMSADGSNVRQVTTGMSNGGRNDWSPDGKWITFYAGPGERKEIYMVPIECSLIGGGCDRSLIRQLTFDTCSQGPAFSPDGQWITFATHSSCDSDIRGDNYANEIAIMNWATGEIIELTGNRMPDWMARWGW